MSKKTDITPPTVLFLRFACVFGSIILFILAVVEDGPVSTLFLTAIPSFWLLCFLLITCAYVNAACRAILKGAEQVKND